MTAINTLQISEAEFKRSCQLTIKYAPTVLPINWHQLKSPIFGVNSYTNNKDLIVLFSVADIHGDGRIWVHVSASYKDKLPSYNDLCTVKRIFIGDNRKALQIFPIKSDHVNIHPFALHLWSAIDGDGLPDFGKFGTI